MEITKFFTIILQIYSQCNIYEAGTKKKTFEFYTEKVKYFASHSMFAILSMDKTRLMGKEGKFVTD